MDLFTEHSLGGDAELWTKCGVLARIAPLTVPDTSWLMSRIFSLSFTT